MSPTLRSFTWLIIVMVLSPFSFVVADQIFDENITYQGSLCVGLDCAEVEALGADVLRIKENNTRMRFWDSSVIGELNVSYQLIANDSSNEGESHFSFYYSALDSDPNVTENNITETAFKFLKLLDAQDQYAPAITLGAGSTDVAGAVSIGSTEFLRNIKHVAAGLLASDILIKQVMNEYDPVNNQKTQINTLQSQINDLADLITVLESAVTAAEQQDLDNDGLNDYIDNDDDGDTVLDVNDAFPMDASEYLDSDGDGLGNNADLDDDNDQVLDINDAFPLNANESLDTDNDGLGNNMDPDDDNDNTPDAEDAFPLDANESLDTDNDGVGNNDDTDDDNDLVLDINDAFPLNANESLDTDNDGIGNNTDNDDDGDGLSDEEEGQALNLDSDNDGIPDYLDTDSDNDGTLDQDEVLAANEEPAASDNESTGLGALYYGYFFMLLLLLAVTGRPHKQSL